MIALVLGDENKANPRPMKIRLIIIDINGVAGTRKVNRTSPTAQRPMPVDATILGSILSDNLPAKGEKTACTTG
jgi:hypothetical protein